MDEAAVVLSAAAIVGGFIRGFSGFGGPMTIIPVLSLYYSPALAIWIMAVVDLAANIYLVPTAARYASRKTFGPLIVGSLLTLPLGIYALILIDAVLMQRIICVAIILACCLLMSGWIFRGQLGSGAWLTVGAASGIVVGATLIAVVTSVFLNAASRDARENRANFIVWGFAIGVAMAILLSEQQVSMAQHLPIAALLAVAYLSGCIIGALSQNRASGSFGRRATLVLIILVATTSLTASYGVFR